MAGLSHSLAWGARSSAEVPRFHHDYSANFVIRQWNVEDGLPQGTVRCITQTHDGYLWVGTWDGLARFDGVHMTVFDAETNPGVYPIITFVREDGGHRLWVGTDGAGLYRYQSGRFVHIDSTSGFDGTFVTAMGEDRAGRMWFATEDGIFINTGDRFLRLSYPAGAPNNILTEILAAPDSTMYLQFVNVVYHVYLSDDSLPEIGQPFHTGGYRIDVDSSGTIWYAVAGKGLVRRTGTHEYTDTLFANVDPTDVFILRNGEKWILTPQGPYFLTGNHVEHLQSVDGIDLSSIQKVFEDREGILWLTVTGDGLLRFMPKQVRTFTTKDGLQTNDVMCGMQDRSGAVWIGTWLGGLARRVGRGEFIPVRPLTDGMTVTAICQSREGTIWVGTWGHGLFKIRNNKVRQVLGEGLKDNTTIRAIARSKGGGVWVAGVYRTLWHIGSTIVDVWDTKRELNGSLINSLLVTRNGDVWVGTDAGGVARLSNGHVSIFNTDNGLIDNSCRVVLEDKDGAVWLTSVRGLERWKDGRFSIIAAAQGFSDYPAQLIQDNEGNYWIGGNHGIHRISGRDLNAAADGKLKTLSFLTLGKADGMPVESCTGGGNGLVWKTRDGDLWFSTNHGAVRINPLKIASNSVPPGVMIEQVKVDENPVTREKEIVLRPGQTNIEIHYTGINFAAPDQIRFRYKLEGFDDHWRDGGTDRSVQYTNLKPGAYSFVVKAENNAGVWNEKGASLSIVVLPTVWQTLWFRTLLVLMFLTVGPAIYLWRVRQLTREKHRQIEYSRRLIQSEEKARQQIANELHDGLGQDLLVLKNKLLVAQQQGQTPEIEEMSGMVSQTIEEVRTISHNLRPHQLDQLGLTKTIRALMKSVRQSSGMQGSDDINDIDSYFNEEEQIGLFRILQEACSNVMKHSGATEIHLAVRQNPGTIGVELRDNGKGMGVKPQGSEEVIGTGFGLSGMSERAKLLGWKLEIRSELNRGTEMELTIPTMRKSSPGL